MFQYPLRLIAAYFWSLSRRKVFGRIFKLNLLARTAAATFTIINPEVHRSTSQSPGFSLMGEAGEESLPSTENLLISPQPAEKPEILAFQENLHRSFGFPI